MSHSLKHISPAQAIGVWFFLVAATVCTGWLADHQGLAGQWTVVVVMFVALLKARAVILYYMGVKYEPLKLRLAFEAWVLIATSIILVFWLVQGGGTL